MVRSVAYRPAGVQLLKPLIYLRPGRWLFPHRWGSTSKTPDILVKVWLMGDAVAGVQLLKPLIYLSRGKRRRGRSWGSTSKTPDILGKMVHDHVKQLGFNF